MCRPPTRTAISSRCQQSSVLDRRRMRPAAIIGSNLRTHRRMLSWLTSMRRSVSKSSISCELKVRSIQPNSVAYHVRWKLMAGESSSQTCQASAQREFRHISCGGLSVGLNFLGIWHYWLEMICRGASMILIGRVIKEASVPPRAVRLLGVAPRFASIPSCKTRSSCGATLASCANLP